MSPFLTRCGKQLLAVFSVLFPSGFANAAGILCVFVISCQHGMGLLPDRRARPMPRLAHEAATIAPANGGLGEDSNLHCPSKAFCVAGLVLNWIAVPLLTVALPGCSALGDLFKKKETKDPFAHIDDGPDPDEEEDAKTVYSGVGSRHYVAKILDEGKSVVLEDGSVWEIDAGDLIYTGAWTNHQDITVQDLRTPPQYRLVNTSTREQVKATYLGTPPKS